MTVEVICASKNHPEQVAKVNEAAEEFSRRIDDAWRNTKIATGEMRKTIVPAANKAAVKIKIAANDVWDYAYRKSVDASKALSK